MAKAAKRKIVEAVFEPGDFVQFKEDGSWAEVIDGVVQADDGAPTVSFKQGEPGKIVERVHNVQGWSHGKGIYHVECLTGRIARVAAFYMRHADAA